MTPKQIYDRKRYLANREKICARYRAIRKTDAFRTAARTYVNRWNKTETGRQSAQATFAKYKSKPDYPLRYRAMLEVNKAVKRGELVRLPCETCGAKKVHAHHDDYSKPLDVRWLCSVHHKQFHIQQQKESQ